MTIPQVKCSLANCNLRAISATFRWGLESFAQVWNVSAPGVTKAITGGASRIRSPAGPGLQILHSKHHSRTNQPSRGLCRPERGRAGTKDSWPWNNVAQGHEPNLSEARIALESAASPSHTRIQTTENQCFRICNQIRKVGQKTLFNRG